MVVVAFCVLLLGTGLQKQFIIFVSELQSRKQNQEEKSKESEMGKCDSYGKSLCIYVYMKWR